MTLTTIIRMLPALATSLAAAAAFASEGGQGGRAEEITFMGDWFPRLVNFAIFGIALVYFLRKPTRDFFANRSAEIERSIRESAEAREKAMTALADMERKVKAIEDEAKQMVADAQVRGERDKQALIEEGKRVAKDVQAQIAVSIEIEAAKAKSELAVEAARLSVDLAEGRIKSSISKQDHERMVKDYVAGVGGRG